jgi:hypothetical protein
MSLQRALEAARGDVAAPVVLPAFARVEAAVRWHETAHDEARPAASLRWIATCGAGLAAITMAADAAIGVRMGVPLVAALLLPIVLLLSSVWLVHRATLGGQLVSRAVWWSYLLLGVAWSAGPPDSLPVAGSIVAISTGMALLAAGRAGLRRRDTGAAFEPVAFRGNLLLSMILGVADVQLLGLMGVTLLEAGSAGGSGVALLSCAALLGVGVWGLSRLRVWAVLHNLAANAVVLVLLALALGGSSPMVWVIAASAIVQLVLPLRMLVAFVRGAPAAQRGRELSPLLAVIVIALAMAVSIPLGLLGTYASPLP